MTRIKKQETKWYRGEHCNWMPDEASMTEPNSIEKYILKGWVPSRPFITKKDFISVFGSCFAEHVARFLEGFGYQTSTKTESSRDVPIVKHHSALVTTFAIRQQLEWAWENRGAKENTWYESPDNFILQDENQKMRTKALLDKTDIFIITFGLSEAWYHKKTGDVFWKAVPSRSFDPDQHGFRVVSCQENIDNINKIVSLIEEHRPDAHIIITLSPVRLLATFRPVSCITANCASKAILRASIDEAIRSRQGKKIHYWPSYEIMTEGYRDAFQKDKRHPKPSLVSQMMHLFKKYYLADG